MTITIRMYVYNWHLVNGKNGTQQQNNSFNSTVRTKIRLHTTHCTISSYFHSISHGFIYSFRSLITKATSAVCGAHSDAPHSPLSDRRLKCPQTCIVLSFFYSILWTEHRHDMLHAPTAWVVSPKYTPHRSRHSYIPSAFHWQSANSLPLCTAAVWLLSNNIPYSVIIINCSRDTISMVSVSGQFLWLPLKRTHTHTVCIQKYTRTDCRCSLDDVWGWACLESIESSPYTTHKAQPSKTKMFTSLILPIKENENREKKIWNERERKKCVHSVLLFFFHILDEKRGIYKQQISHCDKMNSSRNEKNSWQFRHGYLIEKGKRREGIKNRSLWK